MALKGTATIELTNADGSKETYKHDNMITNAVNDLCMSQRGEMATILKIVDNGDSYAQALFGGLLLFDETLNSNPADYFLPTVKCTGYASQDAYAGLDTCRGSFNASEGGLQADGSYKFVWDFSTSQANGTIKSLALCPNMMGQIGLTNSQVKSEKKEFFMKRTSVAPFDSAGKMLASDVVIDEYPAKNMYIVGVIDDIAYAVSTDNTGYSGSVVSDTLSIKNNGGIIKLFRFKLGADSIALSDKVCMASYIDTISVQLPQEFFSSLSFAAHGKYIAFNYDKNNNKFIIFPCQSKSDLAPHGTIKYCEIDVTNNYAMTVFTFTNNATCTIYLSSGDVGKYNIWINKDYVVSVGKYEENNYRLYATKRSDNTQVKEVQCDDGTAYSFSGPFMIPISWKDNILFAKINPGSGSSARFVVIDLSTGKMKDTNIQEITNKYNFDIGNQSVFGMTGYNLIYQPVVNPFILCTKNNLDSPVTKTASQTMKITYTLSVADTTGSEV